MDKIVGLVPLRGGSKSIPDKNIRPIAGKPLCAWVLEAACASKLFDQVYVSTDSVIIAGVVKALGLGITVIDRPAHLATDEASTESVMLHLAESVNFDLLVTIQATSPLLTPFDLSGAMAKFEGENLDSLLTGVRLKRFFWSDNGAALNYDPLKRPMRQQFDGTIMENGAFYFTRKSVLEKYKSRLGGKIGIYEMPGETSVEIDEPGDWDFVEALLKKRTREEINEKLKKIKLLAMDCDGVLTDAGMYYGEDGDELKKFNTRDGQGIALLREKGLKTAIISGEESQAVARRAEKLKIDGLYMGVKDKGLIISQLMDKYNLELSNIAYIGDDLNDLPAIELAGFSFAVNDAADEVKSQVDYILSACGGKGAVREVCSMLLTVEKGKHK